MPSPNGYMQACWPYPHCCGAEKCRPTSTCRASGYASLLALSTLLWRKEVPAHEYVSRFRDKDKFTDVTLDDLAPLMWCVVYGLWSVVFRLWLVVCGLWSVVCGLW